jgi:hypothetical protein
MLHWKEKKAPAGSAKKTQATGAFCVHPRGADADGC